MTNVNRPDQYLAIGTLKLPFPSPEMTVEEVREMYQMNFPVLMNAELSSPRLEGGALIYEATPPPVKTKGKESVSLGEALIAQRKAMTTHEHPLLVRGSTAKTIQRLLKNPQRNMNIKGVRACLPPL